MGSLLYQRWHVFFCNSSIGRFSQASTVSARSFEDHVEKRRANENDGFLKEFDVSRTIGEFSRFILCARVDARSGESVSNGRSNGETKSRKECLYSRSSL